MKTTIYLIRHCESEGNACRRMHAQFDGIVTERGLRQVELLSKRFEDIPVTAVYSSDTYRSTVTAEGIARPKNLPIRYSRLLRENTVGILEGFAIGNVPRAYPEIYERHHAAPYSGAIPGSEKYEGTAERGYTAVLRMAEENPGGVVAAVSHSMTIIGLVCKVLGKDITEYKTVRSADNTSLTKLEVDESGHVELVYVGDSDHLTPDLRRPSYVGRGPENNFDYFTFSLPEDEAALDAVARDMCEEFPGRYSAEGLRELIRNAQRQNRRFAFYTTLPGRICGMAVVRRDAALPADHGLLEICHTPASLRERGFCEQVFGEAFDVLRRQGCRYVVLENRREDPNLRPLIDRFCMESMPGDDRLLRMRLTVPGIEGPIY